MKYKFSKVIIVSGDIYNNHILSVDLRQLNFNPSGFIIREVYSRYAQYQSYLSACVKCNLINDNICSFILSDNIMCSNPSINISLPKIYTNNMNISIEKPNGEALDIRTQCLISLTIEFYKYE